MAPAKNDGPEKCLYTHSRKWFTWPFLQFFQTDFSKYSNYTR